MKKINTLLLITLSFLTGCFPDNRDYDFEYETIISETPANLEKLNTIYDDYNSDLPYPAARCDIYFSSNRHNAGDDFDIICRSIDMSYHKKDDILNFSFPLNDTYSSYQNKLLPFVNTENDEYGPYTNGGMDGWDYFFYANDEAGDFNIKFVYTARLDWGTYNGQERLFGPEDASLANSDHDDLYPTINQDNSRLIFCSNRENDQFDIYSIELNAEELLHDYLTGTGPVPTLKESVLSGSSNDKCPSVNGNFIVFASDRDGGYGGYDLYYSIFTGNQWSTPVNFGEKINSANDEYRPVTFTFINYDLMIFSSNRPGGKGGYDLYCVKIGDLIGN